MKLKRFLSLAVAAIMVMAMVPAMSVSAASTTTVIAALGGEVVWSDPVTSSLYDASVADNWSGWTTSVTAGNVNLRNYDGYNVMQFYGGGNDLNLSVNASSDVKTASQNGDAVVIEWKHKGQASPCYYDFTFKDVNGTTIAFVKLDVNYPSVQGEYKMGWASNYTPMAIVAYNNEDGTTHTVDYYVNGSKVNTESVDGVISGFGSIAGSNGRWSNWSHIGFADLTIGTVSFSETRVEVTAEYTVDGTVVHTETGYYDTAEGETGATFPAYSYSVNGTNVMYHTDGATLSESDEIALEVVANAGTHAVGDIFAKDGVQYEVKSANLVPNGDFAYGTAGWYAADGSAASFFTSNGDGTMTLTAGGTGASGANSLYRAWPTEKEKTYLFTFDANTANTYDKVSVKDDISATADGTIILASAAAGTNAFIFTAANDYVQVNFRWLGAGHTFGNFGLYEIAEAETVVAEEIASVADIASVKVIGDTAVVLPTTVEVTGSLGSTATGTIEWNAPASYEVGETTVEGTVSVKFAEDAEALTQAVSTTVTVLEETFTLSDLTSGGSDNVSYFPVALSGEFTLQFDMTASNYDNLWIYIGANGALWGSGQIGLGWDNAGNGYFRAQPAAQTNVQFATGNNYRFFVTGSAETDTYDLMVVDLATNTVIVTADDYGFRTGSDVVNAIAFTPNGENGVGTMSNIKVNAPGVSKTEYTFNITLDGETSTTTHPYWSAEEAAASVADIAGYEKTVTVEGTTINVVYSAVYTATATFVDANENVIKAVSEVVALSETYTVAAEEIFFLDGNYNGYFYQIPETVLSADNNNRVITVSETANKYAVMEDMLVSDNEVWGMRKTNSNSVFVAAAADANRGAYVDANGENAHDANHTPSTLGKSRVGFFQFPVVDVEEGNKVTANFYVRGWHGNGFSNSNATLRFTATAINDDSWVELSDGGNYDSANAPIFEGYANPVFSPVCYNNVGYVAVDITEMMMAAKAANLETITLRLNIGYGAAYIAEREACVVGGAYAGNASYIAVEDANLVKVTETGDATLTKNGSEMNGVAYVAATDDVRLVGTNAVVVGTDAGYYYANKTMSITEATSFENTVPAALGLAMINGAQVRIGSTDLGEGEKMNSLSDSGLRFIATADYADTIIADDNTEFGIKITAEGSDSVAYIPATSFQNDDNTVFAAAITNLAVSNYNRKYTACGYAKVTMADGTVAEFTTDGVTRSIYQVSAGIMKNGTADANNAKYTVDGVVKNILNAYVNQTGIRLAYSKTDGITVEEGKYTGDVFFTVTYESDGDDGFNVTITPDTTWGTPAEIATWWADYVRFNNNHSTAAGFISDAEINDGVLTFNFDTTADDTGEFDGEWVSIN